MNKITFLIGILPVLSSVPCVFASTHPDSPTVDFHIVCHKIIHPYYNMSRDAETRLCTHMVYLFPIHVNRRTLRLQIADTTSKFEKRLSRRISEHQQNGVKTSVTIDLGAFTVALILRNAANRQRFIENTVEFARKFHLDGLHFVWNPGTLRAFDKSEVTSLFEKLAAEMRRGNRLLSALVMFDRRYSNFTAALGYFDWITPLVVHQVSGKTEPLSPIFLDTKSSNPSNNMARLIEYYEKLGIDRRKIAIFASTGGREYILKDPRVYGLNAPAEWMHMKLLPYEMTCRLLPYDGWKVVRIKNVRDIFVAHNSEHWYTYHNIEHVRTAAKYIQRNQLYGAAVLLDTDDYDNVCDEGKYPLLAAVHSILGAAGLNHSAAAISPD